MNQLAVAGVAAAVIAASAFGAGVRWQRGAEALAERVAEKAATSATNAAVEQIKQIKVQNRTIRQELEREIHYAPVVGAECDVTPGVFDKLNQALTPPADRGTGVP